MSDCIHHFSYWGNGIYRCTKCATKAACFDLLAERDARIAELEGEQDWRKGSHIEGVIAQHDTLGAILEQCQKDNGKLSAELKAQHKAICDQEVELYKCRDELKAAQDEIERLKAAAGERND